MSVVYLVFYRLLEFVVLVGRGERSKELEILVLRHELSVLRRQVPRPRFEPHDRLLLAALSRVLPRHSWSAFLVRPEALLYGHRRLVARRWRYSHRKPGRPPIDGEVRGLILQFARDKPSWGYLRIVGELRKLGITVSATSVRNILIKAGLPVGCTYSIFLQIDRIWYALDLCTPRAVLVADPSMRRHVPRRAG